MSEWQEITVREICSVKGGKRLPAGQEFADGITKFPYLRVTDMVNGTIDSTNLVYVKPEIEPLIGKYKISKDDLYVTIAGTLGLFGSIPGNLHNAQLTENAAKLCDINTDVINKDFLKYYLNSDNIKSQINKEIGIGGGVPKLALCRIERLLVNYPKKTTQRKIARILSTADAVIEKTKAAIAKYKAIKQGMLHDLFTRGIDTKTGKLRPKYQDAPELYKESKLGWIPKEWEVESLGGVGEFKNGVNKDKDSFGFGTLFVNIIDAYPEKLDCYSLGRVNINENEKREYELINGDIIFVRSSVKPEGVGYNTLFLNHSEQVVYCGFMIRYRFNNKTEFKPDFYNYYYRYDGFRRSLIALSTVSANTNINQVALSKLLAIKPKENEQVEIASRLKSIDNKIQTEQSYLLKLQQIKAGLMADLLSGKKEVIITDQESLKERNN